MPDLNELKLWMQQHLTDGLVVVVGSGLSCAEGLPSMTELAAYLASNVGRDLEAPDVYQWQELLPAISAKGLEAALMQSPPSPTLETRLAETTAAFIGLRERRVLSEVFGARRTLRFTRLLTHLLKPDSGLPVITTNYDRLIEVASEEAGLGVDTLFVGDFAGSLNESESRFRFCREVTLRGKQVVWRYRPRVVLCKPHGSLDWYPRSGRPVRYQAELDLPKLIITPGYNKFRNGYESPFDLHRERANRAIDRATRFLIVGYGFNDDHLETHLTPKIQSGTPALLLTHSLSQNARNLTRECENFVAVERMFTGGVEGSRVNVRTSQIDIPGVSLWDLNVFVSEVLEP